MAALDALLHFAGAALVGYLLGSIPSGVLVSRLFGKPDPRTQGSGKTGATNALRTMGLGPALLVVTLDIAKGVAAVLIARFVWFPIGTGASLAQHNLQAWGEAVGGFAALLGHNYSVFIGFKGGRGVATGGGAIGAISPLALLIGLIGLIVPVAVTRYVSLGSMVSAAISGLTMLVLALTGSFGVYGPHAVFALVGAGFIILAHRDNIDRLVHGRERKFGEKAV